MLTVKDVARRWAVSPGIIYKLVAERKLTCYRIGSVIRFNEEHLKQFLESPQEHRPRQTFSHLDL